MTSGGREGVKDVTQGSGFFFLGGSESCWDERPLLLSFSRSCPAPSPPTSSIDRTSPSCEELGGTRELIQS